ncbi:type II toxin-antitoxin system HicB family antitoxin [Crocosphaera sp. UHCC 0190]|uniref:type II toxin-antitoxin system HicB family antitoxin n=1 Tax=Crocosphaera sp. UHCC 0190 TaxID=3110246 RepID=UPI003A522687
MRVTIMRKYDWDGYTINLYRDDDGDWLAYLVDFPNVSAFGDTPEIALDELYEAWEGMKDCYKADGEDVPIAPRSKEYINSSTI